MKETIKTIGQNEAQDLIDNGGFHVRAIIEVIGKPKEHVEETIESLIKKLSEEPTIKILKYEIEEAVQIEKSSLFSTFSEVEIISKSMTDIMNFAIDYTPASIEIIEPSSMNVQASFMSDLMTELVGRLHMIDGEFRKVVAKNKALSESLSTMIKNAIMIYLKGGNKSISDISKIVGVDESQIKIFLDRMIEEKKTSFDEKSESYGLLM